MLSTTAHLIASSQGDALATRSFADELYATMRRIAHGYLRGERKHHTLATTDLVHEAYLRLVDQTQTTPALQSHFVGVASRVMRQVLVDYARRRGAAKRGSGVAPIALDTTHALDLAAPDGRLDLVLSVDRALEMLAQKDERLVSVVECRFYGGLTNAETADALGLAERTVQRDWQRARAYLAYLLRDGASATTNAENKAA
jgi:RNA polymerase sigma factor (TIGR02999 family)